MTIDRIIETASERGAVLAMQALGVTSGELSQRQARKVYGKYFADAVAAGRLAPCRVEDGRAGTKFYAVADILALRLRDQVKAQLIIK